MKRANSADSKMSFVAPFCVDTATQWQLVVVTELGIKTFVVDEKVVKKCREIGVLKSSIFYFPNQRKKEAIPPN